MSSEEPITAKEVAKMLRVTPRMVTHLANQGEIPGFRVGKFWRFYRSDIQEFIDAQRRKQSRKEQKDH